MIEAYIGEIRMFGGSYAPTGWAFCNGQLLTIHDHDALFAILGTKYGGDGRTNFCLPDLRGRIPMHAGVGYGLTERDVGDRGGEEGTTLSQHEMPNLAMGLNIYNDMGNQDIIDEDTKSFAISGTNDGRSKNYTHNSFSTESANANIENAVTILGENRPLNNMQPYLVVNFIIALDGIFPPRA